MTDRERIQELEMQLGIANQKITTLETKLNQAIEIEAQMLESLPKESSDENYLATRGGLVRIIKSIKRILK